jgi:hypothetical protein
VLKGKVVMPVQIINSSNINQSIGLKQASSINFKCESILNEQKQPEKASRKLKTGVFFTTLGGVATALAIMLKRKGYSLNPSKILKTPLKKWGIFGAEYAEKELPTFVGALAVGSVGGGLVGGALFDKKENMKAKYRESVIQLVGNVFTPLACVWYGMKGFEKVKPKIEKYIPDVKNALLNKVFKGTPSVIATGLCLFAGILLGNKVGNSINKHVFKCDDKRKIKASDMSPHIDDLCLSLSIVAATSRIGSYVKRIIPVALMVAGFSTGIAQEKPKKNESNFFAYPN